MLLPLEATRTQAEPQLETRPLVGLSREVGGRSDLFSE